MKNRFQRLGFFFCCCFWIGDPRTRIRDLGWTKMRIGDKHPGSATLPTSSPSDCLREAFHGGLGSCSYSLAAPSNILWPPCVLQVCPWSCHVGIPCRHAARISLLWTTTAPLLASCLPQWALGLPLKAPGLFLWGSSHQNLVVACPPHGFPGAAYSVKYGIS